MRGGPGGADARRARELLLRAAAETRRLRGRRRRAGQSRLGPRRMRIRSRRPPRVFDESPRVRFRAERRVRFRLPRVRFLFTPPRVRHRRRLRPVLLGVSEPALPRRHEPSPAGVLRAPPHGDALRGGAPRVPRRVRRRRLSRLLGGCFRGRLEPGPRRLRPGASEGSAALFRARLSLRRRLLLRARRLERPLPERLGRVPVGPTTCVGRPPALPLAPSLLSSLTLYAYLRVLSVCSQLPVAGETLAIITVRLSPMNESRRTSVSFDPRNGTCPDPRSSARMHSFSASKDLLISAPSMRVWRSFSEVSAPRSDPAKSMKENLPWTIAWQFAPPAAFSRRCAKTDAGTCRFRPPLGPAPPRADDPFVAE